MAMAFRRSRPCSPLGRAVRPARWVVWLGCTCCATWPGLAHASPADSTLEDAADTGVQAAQLLRKAVLTYPEEALADQLHGDLTVLVDVDATGAVRGVRVEAGNPVFHAAAIEAGHALGFSPARDGDTPVASTVRVLFHFAPPSLSADAPIEEIVVHADDPDLEDTHARTTLDQDQLEQRAGDDLAETIEQVPGVTLARGNADATKPIIRGQQERRLLVLNDGIRHESQKWGPDHATEIDPFSAGEISVVRGAAGARYGPDAIGGVVLVRPPPLRTEAGVGGRAVAAYASNGRRPYGAVRLDVVPTQLEHLTVRVEGNASRGASLSTPTYVLGNTASEQFNVGLSAEYRWDAGSVRVGWHHYDFRGGIFYGVQNSTPSEFDQQLSADQPVNANLWSTTYAIDRPYQDVRHDQLSLHATHGGDWGTIEAIYAFQLNRRQEFEQVRASITGPQFDFTLRTHTVDVAYTPPVSTFNGASLDGKLGVQGVFQENVFRGISLLPNYRGFSGGIFGVERLSLRRIDLEVGARYDHQRRATYLGRQDLEKHLRRGTLIDGECPETDSGGGRCADAFNAGTVSVGGIVHLIPQTLDWKLDLSSASRFPNVDEQFLIGSAPSFPVYAIGNPSLQVETAWSASTTVGLRLPWLTGEVSAYGSWIDRYVYFSPELNDEGNIRYDVTIRGTWPTFGYQPINALVYGLDGGAQLGPNALLGLDVRGAMVRAQRADTGEHLIGTPPDQLSLTAAVRPRVGGPLRDTEFTVTTDLLARQSRVDPDADFAPAPDGVVLLGIGATSTLKAGARNLRVGFACQNLLNQRYREYTSLLRYYADNPGRDIRVRLAFDI